MTEEQVREIAYIAWRGAADSYRLYPDNKHTFSDYWDSSKGNFLKFITDDPQIEYHLQRIKSIQKELKDNYEQGERKEKE